MKLISMFLVLLISTNFCFIPRAYAVVNKDTVLMERSAPEPKISLFAKAGSGDYYTLYPEGVKKEDAFIGGFKSAQLDPLEENIYFYDAALKVISKINLKDGKVTKVIGKPKSIGTPNFSNPVSFNDANLSKFTDFTFDKYGNIFILYHTNIGDPNNNILPNGPRLLKASFKDSTVKEVGNIELILKSTLGTNSTFSVNGLSYDLGKYIYLYGNGLVGRPDYGVNQWYQPSVSGPLVLQYSTLANSLELFAAGYDPSDQFQDGWYTFSKKPKLKINTSTINGVSFDYNNTCFFHGSNQTPWGPISFTDKVVSKNNSDGTITYSLERFIGDQNSDLNELGDGGLAKIVNVGLSGSKCFCGDKSGDLYLADSSKNRIRKIFKGSGFISTVIGSGKESVSFSEYKPLKSVSLLSPNSLLIDKSNNLYIVENNRILVVSNLVTYVDKPAQEVKIANLKITKIANEEIENPKGNITVPDLTLDYTYAGEKTVEVKGENIPDGTNIKLLTVNPDGTVDSSSSQPGKLTGGVAVIPVKIEAGSTKIIKAETDPFIPAPGVYLPGTEPKVEAGVLPIEP